MPSSVSASLKKNKNALFQVWIKNQLESETLREDLMSNEDLQEQSRELLDVLLEYLSGEIGSDRSPSSLDPVIEIVSGLAISRARRGFSPRETGLFVIGLKEAMVTILSEEIEDARTLFEETVKINALMDNLSIISFETFIKGREEVILRQTDEITEISTPVISVWEGILALPIIGTLDSQRTQVVMENLLQQIVDTNSSIAILDISGVPAVDSLVAQHLLKTIRATRLMGAECIISGIRPEIAQTIVHLGIDLSGIITKASMASALAYAFRKTDLTVRRINTETTKTAGV